MNQFLKNVRNYRNLVVYLSPKDAVFGVCNDEPIDPRKINEGEKAIQTLDYSLMVDMNKLKNALSVVAHEVIDNRLHFNLRGKEMEDNFMGCILLRLLSKESKRDYIDVKPAFPKLFYGPSKTVELEIENAWGTEREKSLENLTDTYERGIFTHYEFLVNALDYQPEENRN